MEKQFQIQVPKELYYNDYDDFSRFIAYFYQVDLVRKLNPKNILEIGVGNKTVTNYLKQHGYNVTTCDFDDTLEPDYTADVRDLPFEDNSFDVVMACEILEHLPWEEVEKALNEIYRVTTKHVVISVPYSAIVFELFFKFRLPIISKLVKNSFIYLFVGIPYFFQKTTFKEEHYWEMGRKNYLKKYVRNLFKKRFNILKEVRPLLRSYNYFFILEKK